MPDEKGAVSKAGAKADFGAFPRGAGGAAIDGLDIAAAAATLVWLALVGGFSLSATPEGGGPGTISTLVALIVPIALVWIAVITLKTSRAMRAEAERLQATVDAMRQAYVAQSQTGIGMPTVEKRLEEIAAAARQAETVIASFASQRDMAHPAQAESKAALPAPRTESMAESQPALALGTPDETTVPISVADFIRAMNFPDNANDREGFRALRRALDDRSLARLIRAAQDVLTLLSQDGIYMDDLRPDRARPEVWRRFARGERGRTIAGLGGIRDRSSLALAAGRMRQDTIFRDAAHHFLRQFDRTFVDFETNATDQEIVQLSETRTARAFMLLGRVTGIFD